MAVNIGASELGQRLAKRLVFDGDDLFWRNLLALGHETVGAANADAPTVEIERRSFKSAVTDFRTHTMDGVHIAGLIEGGRDETHAIGIRGCSATDFERQALRLGSVEVFGPRPMIKSGRPS